MRRAPQRRLLAVALAAASFVAAAVPAVALDSRWKPFGPGGGTVTGLAVDPSDSRNLYAAAGDTLYGSRDGGGTWTALVRDQSITAVALDPSHPATVYAGGSRVLRSGDGGRSWRTVLDEPGLAVQALAVAPGRRPVVYAAAGDTVRRSGDGGATWTTPFISPEGPIGSIAVSPRRGDLAYVTTRREVYRSGDAGLSWLPTGLFVADPEVYALTVAMAPSSPRTLYVVANRTSGGLSVYRTVDGGAAWWKVRDRLESGPVAALIVDPVSPTKLYMAGPRGVLVSTDAGKVWVPAGDGLPHDLAGSPPPAFAVAADPGNRLRVWAGFYEIGVAQSADGGEGWSVPVQEGLDAARVGLLKLRPGRPDQMFVTLGTQGGRGLASADGGRTWSFLPRRISRPGLYDLAFDPAVPDRYYAATPAGVWRTDDDGAAWTRLTVDFTNRVSAPAPDVLLAASNCGLRRSADGGRTWADVIPCADPTHPDDFSQSVYQLWDADPRILYALVVFGSSTHPFGNRTLASTDAGATWRELPIPDPDLFAVAPSDSRVLYTWSLQEGKLRRSGDGGQTWEEVNAQRPAAGDGFGYSSLAVDSADPDVLYIATYRRVLRSRDGGRTLEVLDPAAPGLRLVTDRSRPGDLFGLPARGGIFVLRPES